MIRDLTYDDLPQLLELAREMHRTGVYAAYPMDEARVAYVLTRLIEVPEALSIGYESKGELVGAFVGEVVQDLWVDVRVGVNQLLYVQQSRRSSGAGVKLIRHFENWAQNAGADRLAFSLYAGINDDRTARALIKLGYHQNGGGFNKGLDDG